MDRAIANKVINFSGIGNYEKVSDKTKVYNYVNQIQRKIFCESPKMSDDEKKLMESKIRAKLRSGKRLTQEELNYLRENNPALYVTAIRVMNAKNMLKERLKSCKSKEEANNVIATAIGGVSEKDPDREFIIAGLNETAKNFKNSDSFSKLPKTIEESIKGKKKNIQNNKDFDDGEEDDNSNDIITPIWEVIDSLPSFDVVQ